MSVNKIFNKDAEPLVLLGETKLLQFGGVAVLVNKGVHNIQLLD
jgi:hypothetical protein